LGFLETDYYERVQKEHADELGIFGRIEAPKFMQDDVNTLRNVDESQRLDSYLSN
jgi:hypothetical protein